MTSGDDRKIPNEKGLSPEGGNPFAAMSEREARNEILDLVSSYYERFHGAKKPFEKGDRIPYARRVYDEKEMTALVDSALDFWLTAGRYTDLFEKRLGDYLGLPFVYAASSGSSANLLAFMALTSPLLSEKAVKRGDEIITVAAGFPTTVSPIMNFGAVPVFCDIKIPEYNIDENLLENALSEKTRAVMCAHTLGNPFNLKRVKEFCRKHGLFLIEDNCDALGSTYELDGEVCLTGTVGDIGTSSFYPPHHITMGQGGAVYTKSPVLGKIIASMRDWGRDCACKSGEDNRCGHRFDGRYGTLPPGYDHKYVYSHLGYNLSVTDMQAAVGAMQLEKLPFFTKRRRKNWQFLYDALSGLSEKIILPKAEEGSSPSWFGFAVTLREGLKRGDIVRKIEESGVQTRLLFAGNILRQPCLAFRGNDEASGFPPYRVAGSLKNTDIITENTFWIGVYPGLSDEELSFMAEAVTKAVQNA